MSLFVLWNKTFLPYPLIFYNLKLPSRVNWIICLSFSNFWLVINVLQRWKVIHSPLQHGTPPPLWCGCYCFCRLFQTPRACPLPSQTPEAKSSANPPRGIVCHFSSHTYREVVCALCKSSSPKEQVGKLPGWLLRPAVQPQRGRPSGLVETIYQCPCRWLCLWWAGTLPQWLCSCWFSCAPQTGSGRDHHLCLRRWR